MTKREYIDELCRKIRSVPADEAQRLVNFVSEAIDDRMEDGMTEEEAVAAMGDMDELVREVLGDVHVRTDYVVDPETLRRIKKEAGEIANTALGVARDALGGVYDAVNSTFAGGDGSRSAETIEDDGEEHRKNYVIDPDGVDEITIAETGGDVELYHSTDGKIHVRCVEGGGLKYEVTKSAGKVRIERRSTRRLNIGGLFNINIGARGNGRWGQSVRVELPAMKNIALRVNTGSGNIDSDIREAAELRVTSGSGDITLRDLTVGAAASVNTASGDVDIRDLTAAEIKLGTVSGDVDALRVVGAGVEIRTVSGDVELESAYASDRLVVKTVSGDEQVNLECPVKNATLESTSGEIEARFYGSETDYTVTARSVSGSVRVPGGALVGDNKVSLRTVSGAITARFRG